jgi:hypothetical protein
MKSALLLAIAGMSLVSAVPVGAQIPATGAGSFAVRGRRPTGDFLVDDSMREAIRSVAAAVTAARTVQPSDDSEKSDWSRVGSIASGRELGVVVRGSDPVLERYLVSVDDSTLTLLKLTGARLPAAAAKALRAVAAEHPGYLVGAATGDTFVVGKLRLAATGVFLGRRKVADLADVIEPIDRNDVVEIRLRQKGRGVWGHLGPVGGYVVGFMSGGYASSASCRATRGRDRCDTGAFLKGALAGSIAGIGYGIRAAGRETTELIYRVP